MSRLISVIIKPTLACGMACKHCYHSPEELSSKECISLERLEKLFRMLSREYDSVWFVWHGGEPLSLPFSFYKNAIDLEKKIFGPHRYGNTIQTNGLGLNRRLLKFCKDNEINIGISHEGPYDDILRHDGKKIESLIADMSDGERMFSVNSTISRETQDKQTEIFRHFRDVGAAVSLCPVLPVGCTACHKELIPEPGAYIRSSIEAFDEWFNDPDCRTPLVPHFLYVLSALGNPQFSDCAHTSCLTKYLCIYPNGDLYPCAKPCPGTMKLGNIDDIESISEAFHNEAFGEILKGTIARRQKCQTCEIFNFCQGGCTLDAHYESGIENNGGDSCRIYREIFTHVKKCVDEIIDEKKDLSKYNPFVRDAVLGKIVNPALSSF